MGDSLLELLEDTDACKWSAAFVDCFRNAYPGQTPPDENWMVTWFANAIETGRNAGARARIDHPVVLCCRCGRKTIRWLEPVPKDPDDLVQTVTEFVEHLGCGCRPKDD